MEGDDEEEVHDKHGDEEDGDDAEELANEVVQSRDGFAEDGVEGPVFDVGGNEEGGEDDGEEGGKEHHGAEADVLVHAELLFGDHGFRPFVKDVFEELEPDKDKGDGGEKVEDLHANQLGDGAGGNNGHPAG